MSSNRHEKNYTKKGREGQFAKGVFTKESIIVMGGNVSPTSQHYKWYWGDTFGMYNDLKKLKFKDKDIYFLAYGPNADSSKKQVDGLSTVEGVRSAYKWAKKKCAKDDLLYIYWVDHGSTTAFQAHDGMISHSELGKLTGEITAKYIVGAFNPCYSGAIIDDISRQGVISITSQNAKLGNAWGWAGQWRTALMGGVKKSRTDANRDGYISITEAYQWIAPRSQAAREHSMYDDNGDKSGSEFNTDKFNPKDPDKDGYIGGFCSLKGWRQLDKKKKSKK